MISRRGDDRAAAADVESLETLLDETGADAETVVDQLRESGPRRHVSDASVDDVLESISMPQEPVTSGGFGLAGGPTRTVSTAGIDEVFEELERSVDSGDRVEPVEDGASPSNNGPDPTGEAATGDDVRPSIERLPSADFERVEREVESEFGSFAGGGPTRTVSDAGVDEILAHLEDEPASADEPDGDRVRVGDDLNRTDDLASDEFDWLDESGAQSRELEAVDPTELAVDSAETNGPGVPSESGSWLLPSEGDSVDLRNALNPPPSDVTRPEEADASEPPADAPSTTERAGRVGDDSSDDGTGTDEETGDSPTDERTGALDTDLASTDDGRDEDAYGPAESTHRDRASRRLRPLVTREELETIAEQAPGGPADDEARERRDGVESSARSIGPVPETGPGISVDCVRPPTDVEGSTARVRGTSATTAVETTGGASDGVAQHDLRSRPTDARAFDANVTEASATDASTSDADTAEATATGTSSTAPGEEASDRPSIWGRLRARSSALLDRLGLQ